MPWSASWKRCVPIWAAMALLAPMLVSLVGGCTRPAAPTKAPAVLPEQRDASVQLALDLFHEAQSASQFRAALNQVSGALATQAAKSAALDDAARKLAQELLRADAAELDDLDAGSPRPLDAVYLESCFLFRAA